MAVSYLYAFVILVLIFASSLAVEVKEGLPHTAFGDLDDDRLTSSLHKTFTVEELAKYGGQNPDFPIYAAVKGVVFDVSQAKDLYGPGKTYHKLTGKDASRAIAKWSLEPNNLNGEIDDLSEDEHKRLDSTFQKFYMDKYPVVGYMKGHEPSVEDINHTWRREDL